MSTEPSTSTPDPSARPPLQAGWPEKKKKDTRHLVLPGILLILLGLCGWLGSCLFEVHHQLSLTRQELATTNLALKEANQRLELNQLLLKRQLELLRAAEERAKDQESGAH